MTMRLVRTELVDSREILPGQWLQSFHAPELATGSRAGQFVHVRTGDLSGLVLRRPFSINTADPATGTITIHFRTIGRGTEWFTRLRAGDDVDMLAMRAQNPGCDLDAEKVNLLISCTLLGQLYGVYDDSGSRVWVTLWRSLKCGADPLL